MTFIVNVRFEISNTISTVNWSFGDSSLCFVEFNIFGWIFKNILTVVNVKKAKIKTKKLTLAEDQRNADNLNADILFVFSFIFILS